MRKGKQNQRQQTNTYLALVQTDRFLAEEALVDFNCSFNVLHLRFFINVLVINPAIPMRCHFPGAFLFGFVNLFLEGEANLRIALERHTAGKHGARDLLFGEHSMESPKAGPGPVLVHALDGQIAFSLSRLCTNTIREEVLALSIPVQNAFLGTFFIVDYKIESDLGPVLPFGWPGLFPVPHEVSAPVLGEAVVLMLCRRPRFITHHLYFFVLRFYHAASKPYFKLMGRNLRIVYFDCSTFYLLFDGRLRSTSTISRRFFLNEVTAR